MAITGKKFLELNKKRLIVTDHAHERLNVAADRCFLIGMLVDLFEKARHLKVNELSMLGYQSGTDKYARKGESSHYFLLPEDLVGTEAIAVVSDGMIGHEPDVMIWVTTLYVTNQTRNFRTISPRDLKR